MISVLRVVATYIGGKGLYVQLFVKGLGLYFPIEVLLNVKISLALWHLILESPIVLMGR